jgi:hypothetical protein
MAAPTSGRNFVQQSSSPASDPLSDQFFWKADLPRLLEQCSDHGQLRAKVAAMADARRIQHDRLGAALRARLLGANAAVAGGSCVCLARELIEGDSAPVVAKPFARYSLASLDDLLARGAKSDCFSRLETDLLKEANARAFEAALLAHSFYRGHPDVMRRDDGEDAAAPCARFHSQLRMRSEILLAAFAEDEAVSGQTLLGLLEDFAPLDRATGRAEAETAASLPPPVPAPAVNPRLLEDALLSVTAPSSNNKRKEPAAVEPEAPKEAKKTKKSPPKKSSSPAKKSSPPSKKKQEDEPSTEEEDDEDEKKGGGDSYVSLYGRIRGFCKSRGLPQPPMQIDRLTAEPIQAAALRKSPFFEPSTKWFQAEARPLRRCGVMLSSTKDLDRLLKNKNKAKVPEVAEEDQACGCFKDRLLLGTHSDDEAKTRTLRLERFAWGVQQQLGDEDIREQTIKHPYCMICGEKFDERDREEGLDLALRRKHVKQLREALPEGHDFLAACDKAESEIKALAKHKKDQDKALRELCPKDVAVLCAECAADSERLPGGATEPEWNQVRVFAFVLLRLPSKDRRLAVSPFSGKRMRERELFMRSSPITYLTGVPHLICSSHYQNAIKIVKACGDSGSGFSAAAVSSFCHECWRPAPLASGRTLYVYANPAAEVGAMPAAFCDSCIREDPDWTALRVLAMGFKGLLPEGMGPVNQEVARKHARLVNSGGDREAAASGKRRGSSSSEKEEDSDSDSDSDSSMAARGLSTSDSEEEEEASPEPMQVDPPAPKPADPKVVQQLVANVNALKDKLKAKKTATVAAPVPKTPQPAPAQKRKPTEPAAPSPCSGGRWELPADIPHCTGVDCSKACSRGAGLCLKHCLLRGHHGSKRVNDRCLFCGFPGNDSPGLGCIDDAGPHSARALTAATCFLHCVRRGDHATSGECQVCHFAARSHVEFDNNHACCFHGTIFNEEKLESCPKCSEIEAAARARKATAQPPPARAEPEPQQQIPVQLEAMAPLLQMPIRCSHEQGPHAILRLGGDICMRHCYLRGEHLKTMFEGKCAGCLQEPGSILQVSHDDSSWCCEHGQVYAEGATNPCAQCTASGAPDTAPQPALPAPPAPAPAFSLADFLPGQITPPRPPPTVNPRAVFQREVLPPATTRVPAPEERQAASAMESLGAARPLRFGAPHPPLRLPEPITAFLGQGTIPPPPDFAPQQPLVPFRAPAPAPAPAKPAASAPRQRNPLENLRPGSLVKPAWSDKFLFVDMMTHGQTPVSALPPEICEALRRFAVSMHPNNRDRDRRVAKLNESVKRVEGLVWPGFDVLCVTKDQPAAKALSPHAVPPALLGQFLESFCEALVAKP